MSQQVVCIVKDDRNDPFSSIKELGTPVMRLTQKEAIEIVERQPGFLFTYVDGNKVFLIVSTGRSGKKYVKTENDGEEENNLLNLPSCP